MGFSMIESLKTINGAIGPLSTFLQSNIHTVSQHSVHAPQLHLILLGRSSACIMLLPHLGHLHFALCQTTFLSGSIDHGAWSSSNITITSFERAYPHEHLNTSCENIADFPGCLSKFLLACFPYSPERIASAVAGLLKNQPIER